MTRSSRTLTVLSRDSLLAKAMATNAVTVLRREHPFLGFAHRHVTTTGETDHDTNLIHFSADGMGIVAADVEKALASGYGDIAVHSYKDLPIRYDDFLMIRAVLPRGDVTDAICGVKLKKLKPGARVGTSSPRRAAQLRRVRSDLTIIPVQGDVDTRLALVDSGDVDAVVLASVGLDRVGMKKKIAERLPAAEFPPAPAQGAIALQTRIGDVFLNGLVADVSHIDTDYAVSAERQVLAELDAGCMAPIAAHATIRKGTLHLLAQVTSIDGATMIAAEASGQPDHYRDIGRRVAAQLVEQGALKIIDDAEHEPPP